MNEEIRILAVAPYEGLVGLLEDAARAYPDVTLEVVVGNLETGLALVIERLIEPCDLILSRGGTAELLRENLDIPVVDIRISPFDVLQAVRLAEDLPGRRALVGFPGITDAARATNDALQLGLDIFSLVDEDDLRDVLARLTHGGYETILCDVISSAVFREAGFGTVLVTSGAESVRASMDEAVRLAQQLRDVRAENRFLRSVLAGHEGDCVIFGHDGRLAFSTLDRGGAERLLGLLRDLLPQVVAGDATSIRRSVGGQHWRIRTMVSERSGHRLVAFYLTRIRAATGTRVSGLRFLTHQEAREAWLASPFSLSGEINAHRALIANAGELGVPLFINGPYGSGRTALACFAYANSPRAAHPLVEVDCALLSDRSRDYLLNHQSSPLFDEGLTLHVKNLESAGEPFLTELLTGMAVTRLPERCGLILSGDARARMLAGRLLYLRDEFRCAEIALPPLVANRERIGALARQYLNQLNAGLSKDVLGIDRTALTLLVDYDWPGNYMQFGRVMEQLYVSSQDHLIRAGEVRELLARERSASTRAAWLVSRHVAAGTWAVPAFAGPVSSDSGTLEDEPSASRRTRHDGEDGNLPSKLDTTELGSIDLGRPLREIERDIAERTIRRFDGNQSAAARALGISRTTIWRMLQREG